MAQGAGKSIKAKGKSGGSQRKNTGKTKPGKREVAPKDRQRVLERSQKKVNLCWLSLYKRQDSQVEISLLIEDIATFKQNQQFY